MKSTSVTFLHDYFIFGHTFNKGWTISAIKVRVCKTPFYKRQYYFIVTSIFGCFAVDSECVRESY